MYDIDDRACQAMTDEIAKQIRYMENKLDAYVDRNNTGISSSFIDDSASDTFKAVYNSYQFVQGLICAVNKYSRYTYHVAVELSEYDSLFYINRWIHSVLDNPSVSTKFGELLQTIDDTEQDIDMFDLLPSYWHD